MQVYISQSHDIYFNLALENWLFLEKSQEQQILFLWQNSPSVVIGRSQNPWLECNLDVIGKDKTPVVRRQSGGGTVYHDLGNLNYTIMSPKKDHNVNFNLELVSNIIRKLGINAYPNQRNDIVVNHNNFVYKISGSAFRVKKNAAFHHGTLLVNADTNKLYSYLHQPTDQSLDTRGVKSHHSKVINLAELKPNLQIGDIIKSFLTTFKNTQANLVNEQTSFKNEEFNKIKQEINLLKSWDWCFGKTLLFTKRYNQNQETLTIEVQNGIIEKIIYKDKQTNISNKKIKFKQSYEFRDFKSSSKSHRELV